MLELFISAIIICIANLLLWNKVLNKKISLKNIRSLIGILFLMIGLMLNSMVQPIFKIIIVIGITIITIKIIYKIELKDALTLSIFTQTVYIIGELIAIIVVLILTNIQNKKELVELFSGTIYANLMISVVVLIMVQFPICKKSYWKSNDFFRKQKVFNMLMVIFISFGIVSVFLNFTYYKENLMLLSLSCLMLIAFYLYFTMKGVTIRNNYLNMYVKYNSTLEALKSYEDILDKYKVSNHENKNQLLMIRNMLGKDNKNEVSKYIDKIVENEYKDDENLMMETSKIPAGGLRALIYSKLLYMKNNCIKFDLKADKKIRSIQLVELEQNLILDICKIVGVFLDNAIDAVDGMTDGSISIKLYISDNQFNISIANNFDGLIELDKIDEKKYTTKGEGHGYGLSLVKEIVNKSPKLKNIRMINDDVFIQILKIYI